MWSLQTLLIYKRPISILDLACKNFILLLVCFRTTLVIKVSVNLYMSYLNLNISCYTNSRIHKVILLQCVYMYLYLKVTILNSTSVNCDFSLFCFYIVYFCSLKVNVLLEHLNKSFISRIFLVSFIYHTNIINNLK